MPLCASPYEKLFQYRSPLDRERCCAPGRRQVRRSDADSCVWRRYLYGHPVHRREVPRIGVICMCARGVLSTRLDTRVRYISSDSHHPEGVLRRVRLDGMSPLRGLRRYTQPTFCVQDAPQLPSIRLAQPCENALSTKLCNLKLCQRCSVLRNAVRRKTLEETHQKRSLTSLLPFPSSLSALSPATQYQCSRR